MTLSRAYLIQYGISGMTKLHELAMLHEPHGFFSPEFKNVLNEIQPEDFLLTDRNKNTPLHRSAASGSIAFVPKELLNQKTLLHQEKNGETILFKILKYGHTDILPKEFWDTVEFSTICSPEDTILTAAARFRQLHKLPPHYLTFDNLADDSHKESAFYVAACNGTLDQLPETMLTQEMITLHSFAGESILEAAIVNHNIEQIPTKLITKGNLEMHSFDGNTMLHILALTNKISHIDPRLIDAKMCEKKNVLAQTVYSIALKTGSFQTIPKECISWKTLLKSEENTNYTLLDKIIKAKQTDLLLGTDAPEEIREVLGEQWWAQNKAVLGQLKRVTNKEEPVELDIF